MDSNIQPTKNDPIAISQQEHFTKRNTQLYSNNTFRTRLIINSDKLNKFHFLAFVN